MQTNYISFGQIYLILSNLVYKIVKIILYILIFIYQKC